MKRKLAALLACIMLVSCCIIPASAASTPFTDVPANAWYAEAVAFTYENHLFSGTSTDTFSPDLPMTRAMLVAVLYRLQGKPDVSGEMPFTDVPENTWYTNAVLWASQNNIVSGMTPTQFAPDSNVTREQMVSLLYRYAAFRGYDRSATNSLSVFRDVNQVHPYALPACRWAVGAGIIAGTSPVKLSPLAPSTRAQVAAILMRFVHYYDDDPTNDPKPGVECSVDSIQVAGKSFRLGMSTTELTNLAGAPAQKLSTLAGYTWWVYGTQTYEDFILVGVSGSTVVSLCASGPGFSYMGYRMGDQNAAISSTSTCNVVLLTDVNDSYRLHCVQITRPEYDKYPTGSAATSATLAGEALVDFHLVNAFRVYHGKSVLKWSGPAATAARLHSEDMARNNYFAHEGLNGSSPDSRMEAQGITYWSAGENIHAGTISNGVLAHDSWVNSALHRSNMLSSDYTHLGVGAAYHASSNYKFYYTEDFYGA